MASPKPVLFGPSVTSLARVAAALWIACGHFSGCGEDDALAGAYDNLSGDAGTTERGRGVGRYGVTKADVAGTDIDPNTAPWLYKVSYDSLTMTPDGKRLLIGRPRPGPNMGWATPGLQLVAYHLHTGQVTDLGIHNVVRINFSTDGATGWLLVPAEPMGTELWQMDVATLKLTKIMTFAERYTTLDVSPTGPALVLSNVPRDAGTTAISSFTCQRKVSRNGQELEIDGCSYAVVSTQTMTKHTYAAPAPLRDLDFVPAKQEMILTWSAWQGNDQEGGLKATMRFQDLLTSGAAAILADVEFANCADEVILAPAHGLALLAPTSCGTDPISVVDVQQRKFVTNLPGFGPVSLVGAHAVGFVPRDNLPAERWAEAKGPIAWIRVDLANLQWKVFPAGSTLPTYLPTPDGQHLLAWTANASAGLGAGSQANLRRMRVSDGQTVPLDNPTIAPGPVAWLPDGSMLTLSAGLLFRIDPLAMTSKWMPLGAIGPGLLRALPGGKEVLLGEFHRPWVHGLDLSGGQMAAMPLELAGTLYADEHPKFVQPTGPQGWDRVVISQHSASPDADCGNRANSAVVHSIRLQMPVPATGGWTNWGAPMAVYSPSGACEGSSGLSLTPPWTLAGRDLKVRFWPDNSTEAKDFNALFQTLQPGWRIALSLGGGPPTGYCQFVADCAALPVAVTLFPGAAPTPWPRQPKKIVLPAGTTAANVVID